MIHLEPLPANPNSLDPKPSRAEALSGLNALLQAVSILVIFISSSLLPAVGADSPPTLLRAPSEPGPSEPRLQCSPVDADVIRSITPLGNLNPRGGHIFPTDHIYLDYGRKPGLPVYAPAKGRIEAILPQWGDDFKVEVRVDEHLSYYVAHLFLEAGIKVGVAVERGQVLGRTSGTGALDLGCVDARVTLKGFVNPKRYPTSTLHAASPLRYYEEPLRTQLYAKVNRSGQDKDGKIDFDQAGRLVGNWFLEGLSVHESARGDESVWSKQLAFIYDVRQPDAVCISIGGTLAPAGIYRPVEGSPDPALVTPVSGKIAYRIRSSERGRATPALLLVQMLADDRVRVQFFANGSAGDVQFNASASVYVR